MCERIAITQHHKLTWTIMRFHFAVSIVIQLCSSWAWCFRWEHGVAMQKAWTHLLDSLLTGFFACAEAFYFHASLFFSSWFYFLSYLSHFFRKSFVNLYLDVFPLLFPLAVPEFQVCKSSLWCTLVISVQDKRSGSSFLLLHANHQFPSTIWLKGFLLSDMFFTPFVKNQATTAM